MMFIASQIFHSFGVAGSASGMSSAVGSSQNIQPNATKAIIQLCFILSVIVFLLVGVSSTVEDGCPLVVDGHPPHVEGVQGSQPAALKSAKPARRLVSGSRRGSWLQAMFAVHTSAHLFLVLS
jgi:hypothetical protein